eukprot:5641121-Prymnesium_polylepis.2
MPQAHTDTLVRPSHPYSEKSNLGAELGGSSLHWRPEPQMSCCSLAAQRHASLGHAKRGLLHRSLPRRLAARQ